MQKKSHEQFVSELYKINSDIKVLGAYSGAKNKIDCECMIHNEKFTMSAEHLLRGEIGCKKCIDIKIQRWSCNNNT